MATYRQTKTVYESDYGDVTVDIILADTYDNIFTDEYYTIDIIDFKDVDKKLENAIGQLSTDEATFEIDESTFKMNNDTTIVADSKTQLDIDNEALELCTTSTSTAFNYIAIFVNTDDTPSFDDALFIGAIDFDYDEEYLTWTGDDYTTTRSPLKKYKFKTTPVQESLFDAISFKSVVSNAVSNILDENHSVFSAGYLDGDYRSYVPNTISTDALLKVLRTEYQSQLSSLGFGTFTITFADCVLDGKVYPTRFRYPLATSMYGQLVNCQSTGLTHYYFNGTGEYMDIFGDDGVKVKLVGTTSPGTYETIYVPTSNLLTPDELPDLGFRNEVTPESISNLLWQNNSRVDDSFTNFLYALATDLGLALEFVFTSQTEIEIRFIPKSEFEKSQLYIKNAEKASSKKFQLEQREEEESIKGVSSHLTLERKNEVILNTYSPTHEVEPSIAYNEGNTTPRSLVSIGSPLWRTKQQMRMSAPPLKPTNLFTRKESPEEWISSLSGCTIPYNTILRNTDINEYSDYVPWNSVSLCNNLYINVDKRVGESYTADIYRTPIGMYRLKQDGTNRDFYSLEEMRNSLNGLEHRDYGRELNLTVPYLMAFSNASNGAGADIKNLTIGRKIVLDTVEYVVTGFKINIQDWKVDIKLENTGRFNYENSSLTSDISSKLNNTQSADPNIEVITETFNYTADGGITAGELVSLKTDSTVEKSVCSNSHYGRVIGVALNDAADTEGVKVQIAGNILISGLSGSVNDAVFLRDVSGTVNTSTTQLTAITGSEDYYLEVGRLVSSNTMRIDIKEGFVIG